MFKQIFYDNIPTQYIICEDGVIYNTKTHKNLYGSQSNGYMYVQLTIEGKPKSFAMHRLIAEYFIPNPLNKKVVHHIDGNQLNNKIENLMWVTQEENCNMKINFSPRVENTIPTLTEEELATEEWRDIADGLYQVSNLGRLKTIKTNYIRFGCQNKNSGYIRWTYVDKHKKHHEIQAHRAVYQAFHPDEELNIINHINGNRADNRLCNLENITQSENMNNAYYKTQSKKVKPIAMYDSTGEKLIDVYASMAECSRAIGAVGVGGIRKAIDENRTHKGFKFKDITPEEYAQIKLDLMHVSQPIELLERS